MSITTKLSFTSRFSGTCNAGGANVGLSSVWKTVCHEAQPWTALESSLRGTSVLLPRLWKGVQAEGAHAEAPQQPPSEGGGGRAGVLDGQPHGRPKRPKSGPRARPHYDPRPHNDPGPRVNKQREFHHMQSHSKPSLPILTTVIL